MLNKILNILGYTVIKSSFLKETLLDARKSINNVDLHDWLNNNFFSLLQKTGINPKHILDIGANRGDWTRNVLQYFPDAYYTMVEPQQELNKFYTDLTVANKVKVFNCGVGNKSGVFKFTVASADDASTFRYSEEDAMKLGLNQIELPVKTIDQLLLEYQLAIPEILKIDAEGLDLEVLEGASTLMGTTEVILIEAAVLAGGLNNTIENVISAMNAHGYKLCDILDLNRPFDSETKQLILVELAFTLENGKIHQYFS